MLIIEFVAKLQNGLNTIRYKDIGKNCCWNYIDLDIETLNLLLKNFGVYNIDNNSHEINVTYCDVPLKIYL
jgi:hypothetical protein